MTAYKTQKRARMTRRILLDDNMKNLSIEIDPETDLCNISANLKNGGKRLLLESILYPQARHIYAQGCIELEKHKEKHTKRIKLND